MAGFIGVFGIFAILLIAFLLSENKKKINYRTVFGAFFLQVFFALLVLYVPAGQKVLGSLSLGVAGLVTAGNTGLEFVFGDLATPRFGFIFAVTVLGIIVFTSSLIAVLYYLKVMDLIIKVIGGGLHKLLRTSKAESLNAAANIFLGQTESPLVVKPFLNKMTRSEIFAVMACGLGSVAGGVLIGYAALGIEIKYLIAASFMAAPGGLLMAKIMVPETGTPIQNIKDLEDKSSDNADEKPHNIVEAAANGAATGLQLAAIIGAMLIAFIGLVALADIILGSIGGLFGFKNLSFTLLLGYLFSPLAFIVGIPWDEALSVGSLLGQKIIFNEFVAYIEFAKQFDVLSDKTQAITTFALCGFANVGSMGMVIGTLGTLAPNNRKNVAGLAFKGIIAGSLSNLMSAALAGIFISL